MLSEPLVNKLNKVRADDTRDWQFTLASLQTQIKVHETMADTKEENCSSLGSIKDEDGGIELGPKCLVERKGKQLIYQKIKQLKEMKDSD